MSEELLMSVVGAAIVGGAYGIISYAKNKKTDNLFRGFDKKKFFISVAGSAIIGGIATYQGVSTDVIANGFIGPLVYQALRKVYNTLLVD